MNVDYWNKVALEYDAEIFDVYASNKGEVLQQYLQKHTDKKKFAIDFGCGIGKAFPILSHGFKKVLAIDISENCLAQAAELIRENGFDNIELKQLDLADSDLELPSCDFAVCVNVAMLPDLEKNAAIIRNISKTLKKEAQAILVLPSLESGIFTTQRLIEWYGKDGTAPTDIPSSDFVHIPKEKTDLVQGLISIDKEPTKHYLRTELLALFADAGLTITKFEKLQYDWETEFASPPDWMKDPYPWDWMIECKKD